MRPKTKNHPVQFNLRTSAEIGADIDATVLKKQRTNKKWSRNDEYNLRLAQYGKVPADVAAACEEMGKVRDRLDFAVKLLRQAGIDVALVKRKQK
jgi:hypothetical protein